MKEKKRDDTNTSIRKEEWDITADPADAKKIIRKHHKQLYKQIRQLRQNGPISPKAPSSLSQPQEELWSWNGSWIPPTSISHWMWALTLGAWPWVLDLGWSVSVVKQSVKGLMAEGCPDGLPEIRATNPSLEGVWPAILMSPTVHSLYHSDLLSKDSGGSSWEILVGQTIVPCVVAANGPSTTPRLAPLLVLVAHLVAWPRPLSLRALGSWSHALLRTELLHLPFTITFG